jgi:hypothetical protein
MKITAASFAVGSVAAIFQVHAEANERILENCLPHQNALGYRRSDG